MNRRAIGGMAVASLVLVVCAALTVSTFLGQQSTTARVDKIEARQKGDRRTITKVVTVLRESGASFPAEEVVVDGGNPPHGQPPPGKSGGPKTTEPPVSVLPPPAQAPKPEGATPILPPSPKSQEPPGLLDPVLEPVCSAADRVVHLC